MRIDLEKTTPAKETSQPKEEAQTEAGQQITGGAVTEGEGKTNWIMIGVIACLVLLFALLIYLIFK